MSLCNSKDSPYGLLLPHPKHCNMKINTLRGAAALLAASMLIPAGLASAKKSNDNAVARNLSTFSSIVRELEMNYVDSVKTDETFKTAIEAMLMTIDPYTEYYTPDTREDLAKMTTGEYGGIGSYVVEREGVTYISGPFEDSPAAKAGLRPGDAILRVDTTSTKGLTSDKVSALLRGKPGSTLRIDIKRPYVADSLLSVDITRAKLATPSVPYFAMVDDGIGYIRLTSFIEKSPREVKDALDSLKSKGALNGLILDLRSNGGGLLSAAVDILGDFLPKGTEVLRTRGRDKKEEKIYKTSHSPIAPDIPLVVLIDGGSASASEITAGAIQDLDRGVLVGSNSFGKGLVQSTRPLPYDGLLKLTVAKYYIPSGRCIQALDYSHRNPDGTVARTPDSLTNVFSTAGGREVRDGGGLKPDVTVDWGKANRLVYNLVRDFWIFDYANRYAAQNPTIPAPEDFTITDDIYADFKQFIDPEKFKYDKVCEDIIKQLREAAELEGYMNDQTRSQIDSLAVSLTHNLQSDLDLKRKEVSEYLAEEIVSRYYFDRGRIIQELKDDPGLKKSIEVLKDPTEYRRLLTAVKESKTPKGAKTDKTAKK